MVYNGNHFKANGFGVPPFIETPMCRTYMRNPGLEIGNLNADLGSRGNSCLFCSKQCAPLVADVEKHLDFCDRVSDETRCSMMFFGGRKFAKNIQMTSEGDPKTSSQSHGAERSPFAG